jgi:hypothetical protein
LRPSRFLAFGRWLPALRIGFPGVLSLLALVPFVFLSITFGADASHANCPFCPSSATIDGLAEDDVGRRIKMAAAPMLPLPSVPMTVPFRCDQIASHAAVIAVLSLR